MNNFEIIQFSVFSLWNGWFTIFPLANKYRLALLEDIYYPSRFSTATGKTQTAFSCP